METLKVAKEPKQEFTLVSVDEAFTTLREMRVHGAGRIARFAAQALRDYAKEAKTRNSKEYWNLVLKAGEKLKSARPTAVSLPNGVNYVLYGGRTSFESGGSVEDVRNATINSANDFITSSLDAVRLIGEIGARRVKNGDTIITHCNSECAISVMKKAHDMGKGIKVFCDETRPKFQGHKTAATLAAYGIDTTLICDSACRLFMDKADKVIVGCDAITVNGALVNKVGTSQVAVLAHEARVNFMVGAETYKIDFKTLMGELVDIEERDSTEIAPKEWISQNPKVKFNNPVFDVTPPEYIDFYITEKGIAPPGGILAVMDELYQYR
ncbi:MAG TPA: ribose 1,5-bisphosphate isomerase [Nitrososphaerales archaeon]